MNLQESIRKVLREEIDIITNLNQLRRRTYLIDDILKRILFANKDINLEDDLYKLIHKVQVWLHGRYFIYSGLHDEEWEEIMEFIKHYIEKKYKG